MYKKKLCHRYHRDQGYSILGLISRVNNITVDYLDFPCFVLQLSRLISTCDFVSVFHGIYKDCKIHSIFDIEIH